MRKIQSTLGHHFNQITKAEFVIQVPADTKNDHIPVEMSPRKQILHASQLAHWSAHLLQIIDVTHSDALFAPKPLFV
jgi:hypothetical protein